MPRRREVPKRKILPDPKYSDRMVGRFTNVIMKDGKKSTAEHIVYGAFEVIEKKTRNDPLAMFRRALDNIRPRVEVKSRRVGGATYQVPHEVSRRRQQTLAIRWLIDMARSKRGKPMARRLADELFDAFNNQGAAVTKKENTHKMAEANSAYSHFAW